MDKSSTNAVLDIQIKRRGEEENIDSFGKVVPRGGFEPPTRGFSVHCSTN